MVVSCCTDEVPEPGQDRAAILGDLGEDGGGRQGCGGSGPPSGSLASQGFMAPAEGKMGPERKAARQGLPAGQSHVWEVEASTQTDHSGNAMQGLGISITPLDWGLCLAGRGPAVLVQAGGAVLPLPPICFLLPLGPRAPRVEADVPVQSSRCRPAHLGNYCLLSGGPAAAPRGKGCRGFFLGGGKRHGPVGTLRALRGSFVGPSGPTQLEEGAPGGPAVGTRLLTPSAG